MTVPPLDQHEFARWRADGDQALASARATAGADEHAWACFLCEQAAQLAVKALLHGVGRGSRGHDLVELARAAAAEVPGGWKIPEATLLRLGRHYIPTRYADAHSGGGAAEHYGADDARQALSDAADVLAQVDRVWVELVSPDDGG